MLILYSFGPIITVGKLNLSNREVIGIFVVGVTVKLSLCYFINIKLSRFHDGCILCRKLAHN